ncbi:uncharacterized protein MICPUCDRAFT_55652 [Micromonas pusilla CCMP1545]|uniref:Predicted protein n=1 Tax=Micromonas pusilla (strain CCMP1545) TaxID=564608 RepID=C1MLB2_MICPC|nr:uncharacterized protein MICPUCDRAFT_55652 [Micromonas pusilla CCMP1545]EEH59906.1 predicted protein [Micromonas pusilla CCMP1545]|eukprot:XP_003056530.1 predicted protein [Micromonas pusilla CCMP1545]
MLSREGTKTIECCVFEMIVYCKHSEGGQFSVESSRLWSTAHISAGIKTSILPSRASGSCKFFTSQGAAYVQCALCHTVTPAPSSEDIAWLTCGSCHIQLMYRSGAASVSCTVCNSITAAPVAPISGTIFPFIYTFMFCLLEVRYCQCGGCRMMLKYSAGALSVQCAACQYITVTIFTRGKRGANMVVVENPPTLDENGHVKNSTSVGLAEDS